MTPTDKGEIYSSNCSLSLDVAVLSVFFPLLAPLCRVFSKLDFFLPALEVPARNCKQEIGVQLSFQSSVLHAHTHTHTLFYPFLISLSALAHNPHFRPLPQVSQENMLLQV